MTLDYRAVDLEEADCRSVRSYLDRHAGATIFYRPEWNRVVVETWGHSCRYYAAYRSGELAGLFPVTLVRHPLFGTKWIAQPYQFDSGVPLADSREIGMGLIARALEDARQEKAHYLEIRHWAPIEGLADLGFESVDSQIVTTNVPIEEIDLSKIRPSHRQNIRRALKAGVEFEYTENLDDLRLFRAMYLRESRDLAAPQAGWTYFANMRRFLKDDMRLYLARLDRRVIGGALLVGDERAVFGRCLVQYTPGARSIHLGKAEIFHTMQAESARGCARYNLGISWVGHKGLLMTKAGWRGTTTPVYQYVAPIVRSAPTPGSYFEGYRMAKEVWRRLPLFLADWGGSRISRWVC